MIAPSVLRRAAASAAACALLLACAGCGSRVIGIPKDPGPEQAPDPATPVAAVQRLAWSWTHLDPAPCDDLIAADYVYSCTVPDGDTSSRLRWFRDAEITIAQRLFVDGVPASPAADYITFLLDPALADVADPRPGKDPHWHRVVSTRLTVGIRLPTGDYRVSDVAHFFVVRGDSARIPQRLRDLGMEPDSTRWWLERWDDSADGTLLSTQPGRLLLLGQVKALYLDTPPAAARAGEGPGSRFDSGAGFPIIRGRSVTPGVRAR